MNNIQKLININKNMNHNINAHKASNNLFALFFLTFFFFSFSTISAQQKVATIDENTEEISLGRLFIYQEDKKKEITIDNVEKGVHLTSFLPSDRKDFNFGFTASAYWFKFQIKDNSTLHKQYFLELDYPPMDKIEFFYKDDTDAWKTRTFGDFRPFAERSVLYKTNLIPIQHKNAETQTYYIKITTEGSLQFTPTLYSSEKLSSHIALSEILIGIWYGGFLVMFLYNIFIYFTLRDISYLYYCIFIVVYSVGVQATIQGHAFQYLWGNAIWWASEVMVIGIFASMVLAMLFTLNFLYTKKFAPFAHKLLWGYIIVCTIGTFACFVIPYSLAISLGTLGLLVLCVILMYSGVSTYRSGNRAALFFTIAWSCFFVGVVVQVFVARNILPSEGLLKFSSAIGSFLEVIFLSIALADKIRIFRVEKEKAQLQVVASVKENERIILDQNQNLESKVQERTQELQQKQEEIMSQNEELQQNQEEILAQREFIETKNKELMEVNDQVGQSIQYASTIQRALLPSSVEILKQATDYFNIYLPKNVVSGDFYWYAKVDNQLFFAAVDCTGHGVPGAFMSMIGNTLLNEIVKEARVFSPERILMLLHEGVVKDLRQTETGNTDGMDVCLVRIDVDSNDTADTDNQQNKTFQLTFAGAKRPLYIYQNNQITELKGDRMHVGGTQLSHQTESSYHNQIVTVQKGDCIYLSSDGFVDSPSPKREKFSNERLKTLLLTYAKEPMHLQKKFLLDELFSFQKSTPQRDDVLLMGIRI